MYCSSHFLLITFLHYLLRMLSLTIILSLINYLRVLCVIATHESLYIYMY